MGWFKLAAGLAAVGLMIFPSTVRADEIADQLQQGIKLYQQGKVSEAISEIEFALAQLRQKKAASLTEIFPPAPSGWKAEKPQSQAAGQALFGGGITASQDYRQAKGNGHVKIQVISDSPLLQTVAMMMQNPMFLQGGNGKLIRINGEKAILKADSEERAEISMVLDNKVLLQVEANEIEQPEKVAQEFASAIKLDKVRAAAGK